MKVMSGMELQIFLKSEHFMIGGNFRKPNLSQKVQQLKFKLE
jgi:hypothetical protein